MGMKLLPLALAWLAGFGFSSLAWSAEEPSGAAEPGVWHEHAVELDYMGFTSTYSCDGLRSKLELLLHQLKARADAKVDTYGCERGYGVPSRFPHAKLTFATLQPVDAAAAPSATAAAAATVPGSWQAVALEPHRPFELQDGDCELMEQFRDKVLPAFATRAAQVRTQCVPHQDMGGPFSLRLQVFASSAPAASK
jgi:hypothetical protein